MKTKKIFLLSCLMLTSMLINAQDTASKQVALPSHSIFLTAGANYDGGYEVSFGSEYFFNTKHLSSLYGLVNYHFTNETWWGEAVNCKKAMAEIGGRFYIPAVKNKFYPYIGLGLTAGIQNVEQKTFYISDVVDEETAPFLFGGVGTVGLEYFLSHNVAIEVVGRIKTGRWLNFILGGGLKFCF